VKIAAVSFSGKEWVFVLLAMAVCVIFATRIYAKTALKMRRWKMIKDEMPKMACPKCGKLYDDFDGLSFSYCPACGYCSHPNSEVIDGREICGICGREIKKGWAT
jgi:Zn finger protein HypA/HybF involved in hydrogenase expression